jgi:hypothetical protein
MALQAAGRANRRVTVAHARLICPLALMVIELDVTPTIDQPYRFK